MNISLNKAKNYAYRLLKIRPRSEKEIEDKLSARPYSADTVKEVILFLKRNDIINDEVFAKSFIEHRIETGPKSLSLMKKELADKGISEPVIAKVISETNVNDTALMDNIIDKKLKEIKNEDKEIVKRKLYSYLSNRGFDCDTAVEYINNRIHAG